MNIDNKKKVIVGAILLAILVSVPLTVSLVSKQQETRSRASASTSLSFTPESSATNPIQTTVGSTIDLNLFVDPGNSNVSFVKYQVTYDPTKVKLVTTNPVTLNSTTFTNVEGPVTSSGSVAQSVSIGADPTKVITQKTQVVTLHFTAVGSTNGATTSISFGTVSEVLSGSPNDQASENVLSTTTPAILSISGNATPPSATSIPIPTVTGTALTFTLLLDGVGSAGDNPNPTGNSLSNKSPLHPQRDLDIQVFDTNNSVVASTSAPVTYDSSTGTFTGAIGLPSSVTSGNYSIKIQTERYLRKLIPGIQQIVSGKATPVAANRLITGDTNNDNVLNVLDYNALLDCGYGQINPLPMNDPNSSFNSSVCQVHTPVVDVDLNDDGVVNSTDYNLFLRELSVQNGD